MTELKTKRGAVANLKAAQVILDALQVQKDPKELAIMLTRAIRADAIANTDDYNHQCEFIATYLKPGRD